MPDHLRPKFESIALVSIDVQRSLVDGEPYEIAGTAVAAAVISDLAEALRRAGRPIVRMVRMYLADGSNVDLCRPSLIGGRWPAGDRGDPGGEIGSGLVPAGTRLDTKLLLAGGAQELGPGEVGIYKPRWGAFNETPLEVHLHALV